MQSGDDRTQGWGDGPITCYSGRLGQRPKARYITLEWIGLTLDDSKSFIIVLFKWQTERAGIEPVAH